MARRRRYPDEATTVPNSKERVRTARENGAADEIERYLEPESSRRDDPARRAGDPAQSRGAVPQMDYYREAMQRLKECGINLREHLFANPLAIDALDELEQAIVKATVGRGVLDRAARMAGEIQRRERDERRANMKRIPYPSVSRAAFDYLDHTPSA